MTFDGFNVKFHKQNDGRPPRAQTTSKTLKRTKVINPLPGSCPPVLSARAGIPGEEAPKMQGVSGADLKVCSWSPARVPELTPEEMAVNPRF